VKAACPIEQKAQQSTTKQCMVKRTRKYSKRERERKECQENIQNLKRSMVGH